MNFTENKKNGQYYRVLKDTSSDGTRNYDRYSFVTDASDVIFSDGTNVEAKLGGSSGSITEINREIAELKKSVSDGKRTVATAITDKGVTTATDASFKVMSECKTHGRLSVRTGRYCRRQPCQHRKHQLQERV